MQQYMTVIFHVSCVRISLEDHLCILMLVLFVSLQSAARCTVFEVQREVLLHDMVSKKAI